MKRKRFLLSAGVVAAMTVLASAAYACTVFRGTFSVQGNASPGTVTVTGSGTGMTQSVNRGVAQATAVGGSINISTDRDSYGRALPQNTYYVRYYNSNSVAGRVGYTDHYHWSADCMYGSNGVTLGTVNVNRAGRIPQQPATFALPTSTPDVAPQESAVCISDNGGAFGNQAPLTIV